MEPFVDTVEVTDLDFTHIMDYSDGQKNNKKRKEEKVLNTIKGMMKNLLGRHVLTKTIVLSTSSKKKEKNGKKYMIGRKRVKNKI